MVLPLSRQAGWRCRVLHRTPTRFRLEAPDWRGAERDTLLAQLAHHPSVRTVRHSRPARSLTVEHDASTTAEDLLATLPDPPRKPAPRAAPPTPLWRRFALPAVALGAAVSGAAPLSTAVVTGCALPIVRRAIRSVAGRRLTIDVLDTAAVGLLVGTGDILAAGVSVAFIEAGERLRQSASGRARRVLRSWMGADTRGIRVIRDGSEPRVAPEELRLGERAVVYPGETIPVDGVAVSTGASVDNRTWTGEPMPTSIGHGQQVLAGGLVADGRLVIEVTAVGEDTRAGHLASALETAIAADTRVSDIARRVADRFVLPTFVAGGAIFGLTGDLSRLASILIVDFGTGIRISVPTAVLTTMVAGARQDVLFRNGKAVEDLSRVDTIVFDKTGTVTTGASSVGGIQTAGGWDEDAALRLAAAAEGHLPHPIARALRRQARRRRLELPEPETVSYHPGGGVEAQIEGRWVLVGRAALLSERDIATPAPTAGESSVVLLAVDGEHAATFQLRDQLKPEAAEAVTALRRQGIRRLWLATGDRQASARTAARRLGLDGFDARMMPEDKVELIARLRREGHTVAAVGDGINDAAALAEADCGVAVAGGADLARETANIVLAGDGLTSLVTAVRLARQGMSLVRENIAIVGVTNGAALTLALTGGLPPLAATAVNNGSTLLGGLNGLRPLRS